MSQHRRVHSDEVRGLVEDQSTELKQSLRLQGEACEALCGMVNTEGSTGTVIFGVSPEGTITGIEPGNLDEAQRTLVRGIREGFDPPIISEIEILECEDKLLIVLRANRQPNVPYHEYRGRAYIREGSTRRQLSYTEK